MSSYPKDDNNRKICTRARALTFAALNADHWEFKEITGTDHGTDCLFELIEEDEYRNHSLQGQIKGTTCIQKKQRGNVFAFSLESKLINYALNSSSAFVLFLVDIVEERVYYLPIQDFFINNPDKCEKIDQQASITVYIPNDNILCKEDNDLQEIAKSTYIRNRNTGRVKLIDTDE